MASSKVPGLALAGLLVLGAGWSGGLWLQPEPVSDRPAQPVLSKWLRDVKPCDYESGDGPSQTYPCVWDGRVRRNGVGRVILYVRGSDGGCPKREWHAMPAGSVCIDVDGWTGQTEDEAYYVY